MILFRETGLLGYPDNSLNLIGEKGLADTHQEHLRD